MRQSRRRLCSTDVEPILMGKQGLDKIGVEKFKEMNFRFSSGKLNQTQKAHHNWVKMINHTYENARPNIVSEYITEEKLKRGISELLTEMKIKK